MISAVENLANDVTDQNAEEHLAALTRVSDSVVVARYDRDKVAQEQVRTVYTSVIAQMSEAAAAAKKGWGDRHTLHTTVAPSSRAGVRCGTQLVPRCAETSGPPWGYF